MNSITLRSRLSKETSFRDGFTQAAKSAGTDGLRRIILDRTPKAQPAPEGKRRITIDLTPKALPAPTALQKIQHSWARLFRGESHEEWKEKNRTAVQSFKDFLIREYGEEKVRQVERDYHRQVAGGLDLDAMIKNGRPLTAQHVYLFNIGVNNFEQQDIERLLGKIRAFRKDYDSFDEATNSDLSLFDYLTNERHPFTAREARRLLNFLKEKKGYAKIENVTYKDLLSHFAINQETTSEKLDSDLFNDLVSILQPDPTNEDMFTGKMIHAPIKGAYHDGVFHTAFRPWLDQQELLQLFPDLEKPRENGPEALKNEEYYELLAKSVVKKHLVHADRDSQWRIGALIPAPPSQDGKARWYRVDKFVDSAYGRFYYVLVPANENYEDDMPVIVLFRSTASDPYAMSGGGSVIRDFGSMRSSGPESLPGYKYSDTTEDDDYELLDKISISPAQAYFNQGETAAEDSVERFDAFCEALKYVNEEDFRQIAWELDKLGDQLGDKLGALDDQQLLTLWDNEQDALSRRPSPLTNASLLRFSVLEGAVGKCLTSMELTNLGKEKLKCANARLHSLIGKALPEESKNRIARPVVFAGDSLGGFDVQHFACRYFVDEERIPTTPITFYAHSAPRLAQRDVQRFNAYIDKHKEIIEAQNTPFTLMHKWEEGDIVPGPFTYQENGKRLTSQHLGYGLESTKACAVAARHFIPNDSSEAYGMALPRHAKRTANAQEGIDYTKVDTTVQQFDDSKKQALINKVARNKLFYLGALGAWKAKRYFVGRRGFEHNRAFEKLTVTYQAPEVVQY